MKKYFIYAVSALALAGCSSDDFLGGQPSPTKLTDNNVINFNGSSSATTRGVLKGTTNPTAASKLGENFVVYGYKTLSGTTPKTSVVYDHYNVNWAGTANHTESNTNGWEYVGYAPNALTNLPEGSVQTIKYWDYSAEQYDFIAFSFGSATQVTTDTDPVGDNQVKASKVTIANNGNGYSGPTYTLTGAVGDLANVYIADRVTAKMTVSEQQQQQFANRLVPYGKPNPFNFRSLGTKVRIGLYEIIPGYSVKDVKFYKDDSNKNDVETSPCLYASRATIPAGSGTMTVSFPTADVSNSDYNKAHVSWAVAAVSSNVSVLGLTNYSLGSSNADLKEAQGNYLVRTSTDARNASYKTVLPAKVGALKLKVDYTLVSIDGSKEEINVTGATAVVPEVYTNWEPNYAYTYIFKISDNTNGSTGGTGAPAGLYPITFDAIVTETEDGLSETITTVSEPSITTYAEGAVGNEYKSGSNVYVSVVKAGTHVDLSLTDPSTNCALYTVESDNGYNGVITESTVANCIAKGTPGTNEWIVTDTNGKKMTVKTASGLSIATEIEAGDAADGNAITGNFAKFTPTAGTYVFEYTDKDDPANPKKYYKVIKVN